MVDKRITTLKDILIVLCFVVLLLGKVDMSYTDLLMKMANGETLTDVEKNQLALEARRMEQTAAFINSMIMPGSGTLKVDHFIANDAKITDAEIISATAGGGDILINASGIFFKNQEGKLDFQTSDGTYTHAEMYIDGNDFLTLKDDVAAKGINVITKGDTANSYFFLVNVPGYAALPYIRTSGSSGSIIVVNDQAYLYGAGVSTSTSLLMNTNANNPAETIYANAAGQIYFRNDKLVIKYNDGGTIRYKYLDLTGTGVTWTHTTVAP